LKFDVICGVLIPGCGCVCAEMVKSCGLCGERKCAENYSDKHSKFNLFFKTAICILVISNHNSFRVLSDKIASVYFIGKIYLYFSIGNGQPMEPALCQLHRHTFVRYRVKVSDIVGLSFLSGSSLLSESAHALSTSQ